jgi:uncharacterized protein YpmB
VVKEIIYTAVATIVLTGFAYAMDQRIDQRVEAAINASEQRRLENQINFYLIKEETAGLTGEDRINQSIIERQLQKLRAQ